MVWRRLKYFLFVALLVSTVSTWAVAGDEGASKRLTTEQLLYQVRSLKNPSLQPAVSDESIQDIKCGFGIQAQVISRWKEFSQAQRAELSVLMQDSVMQCDTIAGHFRIFYDTTGINEPALLDGDMQRIPGTAKGYIHLVAQVFNHVWDVEVDQMGYAAPPLKSDSSYYNIFVKEISDYGLTTPIEPQINGVDVPPRYYSYIQIDNDYQENRYSRGRDGLYVTAAHEFHHAIQIGSYGYWGDDLFAYELTSTWMEDVVYTNVNDYYYFVPNYFNLFSAGLSFNYYSSNDYHYGGYERSIFAHCLVKIFGPDIMKDIWTGMQNRPFLESTDAALVNHGSNLQSAFAEFTKWNYFTYDRADTMNYYPEGIHYPRFQPLQKTTFYNATSTTSGSVQPLSSSMYEFDLPYDTVTAIIANVDIGNAVLRNAAPQKIDITLSSGLQTDISVANLSLWRSFFIKDSTQIPRFPLNASPNPFRLAESQKLFLPIHEDNALWADVFIYNSAFSLSYSGHLSTSYNDNGGTRVIEVPASAIKSKLSSGIYFILARTKNSDYKWKVAVIR